MGAGFEFRAPQLVALGSFQRGFGVFAKPSDPVAAPDEIGLCFAEVSLCGVIAFAFEFAAALAFVFPGLHAPALPAEGLARPRFASALSG